ncbi:MAG TPA: hypothetical protein VF847_04835 [Candidatus Deferrimicrobiaceae bacterium]
MNQDDYIIRIIRDRQERQMVVGTVEQAGERMKTVFTDFEELRRILGVPRARTPRREKIIDHPPERFSSDDREVGPARSDPAS